MKNKTTATLLCFFLGGFGGHKFYLGKTLQGFIYLIFFWTFIPGIIALIEFIILITMDQNTFDSKYNVGANNSNGFNSGSSKAEELDKLFTLKEKGAITQEEFDIKKKQLL